MIMIMMSHAMYCKSVTLLQHDEIENENWNEKIVQNWN